MADSVGKKKAGNRKREAVTAPLPEKQAQDGRSHEKILEGALSALARHGDRQLSMVDVCQAAGVSRATLYRYYSTKEALLDAVGEYVSSKFIDNVRAAADQASDPRDRMRRVLEFTVRYTTQVKSDRIIEIAPHFVLHFLQSHFHRHVTVFNEVLDPVYADLERQFGFGVNRLLLSEMLLRSIHSMSLIPGRGRWNDLAEEMATLLKHVYETGLRRHAGRGRGLKSTYRRA